MPIPLDPRKKASNVKVHVKTGAGVDITWADGHDSHYDFAYLREECPCATCNDSAAKRKPSPRQRLPPTPFLLFLCSSPSRARKLPPSSATTPCKSPSRMATLPASIATNICAPS